MEADPEVGEADLQVRPAMQVALPGTAEMGSQPDGPDSYACVGGSVETGDELHGGVHQFPPGGHYSSGGGARELTEEEADDLRGEICRIFEAR